MVAGLSVSADDFVSILPSGLPFLGCWLRRADPHQNVAEVVHGCGDEIDESVHVPLAEREAGSIDVIGLYVVVPSEDLQDIRDLGGSEQHAGQTLCVRRYTHIDDDDGQTRSGPDGAWRAAA